ncbi:MAG TPA: hypothetical protein VGL53_21590 [Bryobacteraceae bacterium]|jgi:hypothetical protein
MSERDALIFHGREHRGFVSNGRKIVMRTTPEVVAKKKPLLVGSGELIPQFCELLGEAVGGGAVVKVEMIEVAFALDLHGREVIREDDNPAKVAVRDSVDDHAASLRIAMNS